MGEVLLSRPGRCANRRPPGKVCLYSFQILLEQELSGLALALSPGRNASEEAGAKCKPESSRTGSTLQLPDAVQTGTLQNSPDRHSPEPLIEVLSNRPAEVRIRHPPGQVALYNLQVPFGPELSGLALARSHGRSAFEPTGPVCESEASRAGATL